METICSDDTKDNEEKTKKHMFGASWRKSMVVWTFLKERYYKQGV